MNPGYNSPSLSLALEGLKNFRGGVLAGALLPGAGKTDSGDQSQAFRDVWRDQFGGEKAGVDQFGSRRTAGESSNSRPSAKRGENSPVEQQNGGRNSDKDESITRDKPKADTEAKEANTDNRHRADQHSASQPGDSADAEPATDRKPETSAAENTAATESGVASVDEETPADPENGETPAQTVALDTEAATALQQPAASGGNGLPFDGNVAARVSAAVHAHNETQNGIAQSGTESGVEVRPAAPTTAPQPTGENRGAEAQVNPLVVTQQLALKERGLGAADVETARDIPSQTLAQQRAVALGLNQQASAGGPADALNLQVGTESEAAAKLELNTNHSLTAATGQAGKAPGHPLLNTESLAAGRTDPALSTEVSTETLRAPVAAKTPDAPITVSSETLQLARALANRTQVAGKPNVAATEALKAATQAETTATDLKGGSAVQAVTAGGNSHNNVAATRSFAAQNPIPFQPNNHQFLNAVAERVMRMASQNIQAAELHLDPPDLGPIQVRVAINQDQQASVNFVSHHATVRDQLDLNVMRLRDMFADEGLNLVNVDVSDRSEQQAREQGEQSQSSPHLGDSGPIADDGDVVSQGQTATIDHINLVDFYA